MGPQILQSRGLRWLSAALHTDQTWPHWGHRFPIVQFEAPWPIMNEPHQRGRPGCGHDTKSVAIAQWHTIWKFEVFWLSSKLFKFMLIWKSNIEFIEVHYIASIYLFRRTIGIQRSVGNYYSRMEFIIKFYLN